METQEKPKKKFNPALVIIGIVVLTAAFIGIKSWLHSRHYESTDNASIEATNLPVLARVAGYIDSVSVKDYGTVTAGQLLLVIDDREYKIALQQAEADQQSANADLENSKAGLENALRSLELAKSNLEVQKARLDKSREDMKRDQALFEDGSITTKQLDDSKSNQLVAQRIYNYNVDQVGTAQAQIRTANAQIQKSQAQIETRKSLVDQARLKLSFTKIYAPATGKIGRRGIDKGQYVQPGQTLFTIINSENFWVIANFKETQLEKMKEGQEANIELDGYPDLKIKGKVASMSEATGAKVALLPPDNSTGNFVKITQRVPVKIEIENLKDYKAALRSGLSLTAEVKVN
ncbi:MAG: HlyD family secretion protein [Cyclobacteriaceae bacterium]|nr:HlyD family secretion protein [Cyclobacteriaceae bacterium]